MFPPQFLSMVAKIFFLLVFSYAVCFQRARADILSTPQTISHSTSSTFDH